MLMQRLSSNVVEVVFQRRIIKADRPFHRRALITNCNSLLNSQLGREVLHFFVPRGVGKPYSIVAANLVLSWDIIMQDYRNFSADGGCDVVTTIPVASPEQQQQWWQYFYDNIYTMPPQQKLAFLDS